MKKTLKITGIILFLLVGVLLAAPFLFKDKIKDKVLELANENLNATVSFKDVSLNFLKNFPNATVSLTDLAVLNKAPFAGDTLVYANKLALEVNLKDIVLKNENEPYKLKGFGIENALVSIRFNPEGKGNFDIVKATDTPEEETQTSNDLALNIDNYYIDNLEFRFKDEGSKMSVLLDSLYHKGVGSFAEEILDLDTTTKTNFSFAMNDEYFFKNAALRLDAILGVDLKNQKYTFKDNEFYINDLGLVFDGFVQLIESGQKYNLNFKTPKTSFENFLALLPKKYTKDISGVKTTGNFIVQGKIDGDYTETTIPKLAISMLSQGASLKYPDLPKTIQNINIDVKIANETQKLDDTYVNINNFGFTIDQDVFSAKANLTNLLKNPNVKAKAKGTVNLENIKKAYPVPMDLDLKGIFKADLETSLDMASVENKNYENIKNSGQASLENFIYSGAGFINPFHIDKAALNFNTAKIELTEMVAKTGKTDFNIKGILDNFYGFVFRNEVLKGNFSLNSNTIAVSDFMQETKTSAETSTEVPKDTSTKKQESTATAIKVPAFLDCTFDASVKNVIYDNLTLKNVLGKLIVKDEKVTLQNLQTDIFSGKIAIAGDVSTKTEKPTFNVKLDISKINIVQSFTEIKMLEKIAPIASVIQGFFNSDVSVSGILNADMSPDLNSIKGNMATSFQDALLRTETSTMVKSLEAKFPKINLSDINLNKIKTNLTFDNGRVNIAPFDIQLFKGGNAKISGSHGFDQTMNYNLLLDVPPAVLGADVEQTLAKLSASEQQKIANIPVSVGLTGDFSSPKISFDTKSVIQNLTKQIVQGQANKLIDKGVDKGLDVLNSVLGGSKTETNTPSTATDSTKTQPKEQLKKAAGNLLNGFLNRKKDTTSQKK